MTVYVTPRQRRRAAARDAVRLERMRATEERIKAAGSKRKADSTASRSGCRCRNHMGTRKNEYPSEAAAVEAILSFYLRRGGGYRVAKCSTSDKWHIVSKKEKK